MLKALKGETTMHKKPEILNQKVVAQSHLFKIERLDLRFSNGVERTYERLVPGGRGAVMLIPMIDDEHVALIREYAGGIDDYTLTLPKGALDAGETIYAAAQREMQEEIGYGGTEFVLLKRLSLSPNYMSGGINTVLVRGLYESRLEGDEPEPLEVVKWRLDELDKLYQTPEFTEGRAIAALTLAQKYLKGKFKPEDIFKSTENA